MQCAEAGIALDGNLEAKALQRLLEQRDVVVWVGEPANLARVALIPDQQRNALLGLRGRWLLALLPRGAHLITTKGADQFFAPSLEKVEALQDYDRPHPVTVQAAVATLKRYLSEDKYRIALHDLFMAETTAASAAAAAAFAQTDGRAPSKENGPGPRAPARSLNRKTQCTCSQPRLSTARLRRPDRFSMLFTVFVAPATEMIGGYSVWASLRKYPALIVLYAAGLAASAAENFAVLTMLAARPSILPAVLKTICLLPPNSTHLMLWWGSSSRSAS